MPIDMCRKCYALVQRKSVNNVQERPGIYTGFVKVDIEISKKVKFILKLQSFFQGNLETHQRTFLHIQDGGKCI